MSTTLTSSQPLASAVPQVKQSRVIRASRQAAYDAWTRPELLLKWWGPVDHVGIAAEVDLREGGALSITVEALPGAEARPGLPRTFTSQGVYIEVVPNERLQFTLKGSWNTGEASLVSVDFRDADGGTEVIVLHEKLPADSAHLYNQGWASTLGKLASIFAA